MLDLTAVGGDVYTGRGPQYPWGGLYGGQIVAQGLRAAAASVADADLGVHSLRAYFIRRGDHTQPVRFEVDRLRDGRSFATRRVVAGQAMAILNLEASFQRPEGSVDVTTIVAPSVPPAETLPSDSWSPYFERCFVPPEQVAGATRDGSGRAVAWMRLTAAPAVGGGGGTALDHACALAYLSDDLPTDAVTRAHPMGRAVFEDGSGAFSASLDHTIWFHRPLPVDAWHLHDFTCHGFVGGRGLAVGHVFAADGRHCATIAQEVLLRSAERHAR